MESLNLSFEQMHTLYLDGVIGQKEFRNWLSIHSPSFAEIRDPDIDASIDAQAKLATANLESLWTPTPGPPGMSTGDPPIDF